MRKTSEVPRVKSTRLRIKTIRREINYLRTTIESYDGMALVRTIDPMHALLELFVAPGCEELVLGLLSGLRGEGVPVQICEDGC